MCKECGCEDLTGVPLAVTEAAAELANTVAAIKDECLANRIQGYAVAAADTVGGVLEDDETPTELTVLDDATKQTAHDAAAKLYNAAGDLECKHAAGVVQTYANLAADAVGLPLEDDECGTKETKTA